MHHLFIIPLLAVLLYTVIMHRARHRVEDIDQCANQPISQLASQVYISVNQSTKSICQLIYQLATEKAAYSQSGLNQSASSINTIMKAWYSFF